MTAKWSKYDTNPLDEKVADRAQEVWGYSSTETPTEELGAATREIGRPEPTRSHPESEAPTRRIDNRGVTSYPSVFIPPSHQQPVIYQPPPTPAPNVYLPPPMPVAQRPLSQNVAGLGIPERWANLLPYIPGHIGAVAGVVELLLVPRAEARARFHAAQGLALQLAILILTLAFSFVHLLSGSSIGSDLFSFGSTIFLIVSMVRVWKGRPHHIAPLDDATKWLDERIKPRK
jgi:uncharacterized membrane protein